MAVNKLHTDQCEACPSGQRYMLCAPFLCKPHGHSISHFARSLVPALFQATNFSSIFGVVLPKLFQFLSVLMAGPRGAKRSGSKKNVVDKENEDTNRSLSA